MIARQLSSTVLICGPLGVVTLMMNQIQWHNSLPMYIRSDLGPTGFYHRVFQLVFLGFVYVYVA